MHNVLIKIGWVPGWLPCIRCSYLFDPAGEYYRRDRYETTTSGTRRTGRHAVRTAEQCAQHGSQSVEGGFTEEGSTTQAVQRTEAGRKETRFLTPRNLSRLLQTYLFTP